MKSCIIFRDNGLEHNEIPKDKLGDAVEHCYNILKQQSCNIGKDGHLRDSKGNIISYMTDSGWWATIIMLERDSYVIMPEHFLIWRMENGRADYNNIGHINGDISNNSISNLFLSPKEIDTDKESYKVYDCDASSHHLTLASICNISRWNTDKAKVFANEYLKKNALNDFIGSKRFRAKSNRLIAYEYIVDYTRNKNIGLNEEIKDYALGLSGEVGEVNDLIKKMLYHGKEVNYANILYELGDILYYLTALGACFGFDLQTIATNNNIKLMSRYPNGFNKKDSNNRIEDETKA